MGGEEDDGDPPIDSAESYKAWLQKSAAKSGLSPEDSAGLMNMLVTEPDGSIDMDATMVKTAKEFANFMPQLLEMFTEWIGLLEKAKADTAQWSTYTPEERKSVDDAIADGKAQLPAMQAQIKQMQAQMPQLDQAMANRKTAGNNMKIPATAPMEELDRIKELSGLKGEGSKWRDPKYKDKFYTQDPVADDEDDFYYDSDYYGKSRPENDPGKKQRMGGIGSEFGDNDDPMSGRYTIRKTHMPHEFDGEYTSSAFSTRGPRKGMITKQHGRNMKDKIRGSLGTHNEPNLPESAELAAMLSIAGLR
jgi:hypothetical protein